MRRGASAVLILFGAGAAVALHRPPDPAAGLEPAPRLDEVARARREQQLTAGEASVRLLRGLEDHLAERRAGP